MKNIATPFSFTTLLVVLVVALTTIIINVNVDIRYCVELTYCTERSSNVIRGWFPLNEADKMLKWISQQPTNGISNVEMQSKWYIPEK